MKKILDLIRNLIWDALLFFNHSSPKLTGQPPADISGKIVVSLHRNGMLDLFLVRYLWPEVVALTSVQWHQNSFTRWLIGGVGVTRGKDKGQKVQAENYEALEKCAELLKSGRAVGVAPEGSSQLGPGHLPFQKAAARVAAKVLETEAEVRVLPVSPVYLKAWAWRSPVELYVGPELIFKAGTSMNEIHREIVAALESVSLKAPDFQSLMARQAAAWELSQQPDGPESFSAALLESSAEKLDRLAGAYRELHSQLLPGNDFFGALVFDAPSGALHRGSDGDEPTSRPDWRSIATDFKHGRRPNRKGALPSGLDLAALQGLEILNSLARLIIWPAHWLSRRLRSKPVDDINVVALWRGLVAMPIVALWLFLVGLIIAGLTSPFAFFAPAVLGLAALVLEPRRLRLRAWIKGSQRLGPAALDDYGRKLAGIWNDSEKMTGTAPPPAR